MRTKVNPNRMELLKLKKKRILAQRGHSLLQDKLEKLISEFHKLIKEFKQLSEEWEEVFRDFFESFVILKIQAGREKLKSMLAQSTILDIAVSYPALLNLKLPVFSFNLPQPFAYSPKGAPCQEDALAQKCPRVIELLFKITSLYFALKMVGEEIRKTRRRVNALEYILIPEIEESVKFIETKLTDLERESLSRLLRIKDVIRK